MINSKHVFVLIKLILMRDNKVMKRYFSCFILILVSVVCFACKDKPTISYEGQDVVIALSETFTLNENDIIVSNTDEDYEVIIVDESIAIIDNLTVIPNKVGETKIRVYLKNNKKIYCDIITKF